MKGSVRHSADVIEYPLLWFLTLEPLFEESSFFPPVGHPFPAICIRTSTERLESLDKACIIITDIDEKSLLQAVDTAVTLDQNGDSCISAPDYIEENVPTKLVKIIQSYVGIVNKTV